MAVTSGDPVPPQFVPMRVTFHQTGADVSWCFDGGLDFDDPFFDETLLRCLRRPFGRAFRPQTPIAALTEFAEANNCRPPDAFIFHMSRCGSTLLSQMFTALPATRVISEATTIDRVLYADRLLPGLPAQTHREWLRAIVLAYGASAPAPFARHVVKLDAWHVDRLGLIEQTFPEVPWVFLFRHPLEVLVSNLALRSASMLPGASSHGVPGLDLGSAVSMPAEQYLAMILKLHMRSALEHRNSPRGLYVDYADLPEAALPAILAHWRMAPDASEIARMLTKARRNAKQPASDFVADSGRKQESASPEARQVCDSMLLPAYEALRAIRWQAAP
ncbi:MAG: aspartyl beta-hydroxylase [Rhodanobacteraceae bacterium]|nr:aspartyl beta-hydroxylase [Rhodanobacteraceae bacterium]